MTAGIAVLRLKLPRGVVQRRFVVRAHDARLDGYGLVGFVQPHHLVHVGAHDQGEPPFGRTQAEVHRTAPSVDNHGYPLTVAVTDQLADIVFVTGVDHQVGNRPHLLLPEDQRLLKRFARCLFQPGVVVGGDVLVPNNPGNGGNVVRGDHP